jgi:hypothetical protein
MGHILHGNFFLKHLIEGKIEGGIEVTERRGGRRKQLMNDLKEKMGYCKLKEEALDRAVWRTHCGTGYGNAAVQSTE